MNESARGTRRTSKGWACARWQGELASRPGMRACGFAGVHRNRQRQQKSSARIDPSDFGGHATVLCAYSTVLLGVREKKKNVRGVGYTPLLVDATEQLFLSSSVRYNICTRGTVQRVAVVRWATVCLSQEISGVGLQGLWLGLYTTFVF